MELSTDVEHDTPSSKSADGASKPKNLSNWKDSPKLAAGKNSDKKS
jgi:hypothetical protein